jgi:DNA invertase Pin-like site-specific DNA recombinase
MIRRVAIYARVSTADQNPEAQLLSLRHYAAQRGFHIHHEYVDQVTGAIEKRKRATAYDELLKDAHRRKFNCVLVWKFDRFARSLISLLEALKTFETLSIDFISATQAIDTTTPTGKLFFSIVGAFAEFEREMITERVRAGIDNAKRKGIVFGRPRDLDVEALVLQLRENGLGVRAIARKVKRDPAGITRMLRRLKGE